MVWYCTAMTEGLHLDNPSSDGEPPILPDRHYSAVLGKWVGGKAVPEGKPLDDEDSHLGDSEQPI